MPVGVVDARSFRSGDPSGMSAAMAHRVTMPLGLALALLAAAVPAGAFDGTMPVPPAGPHIFAPGPRALGLQGPQADPSSVGDFDGTVALVYLNGRATDGDGHRFVMVNDMRIMTGD